MIWTLCNTTTADNFTTGSRAALRGGTTTVVDFACPNKGGEPAPRAGAVAPEGRRPHLLRLRLHMTIDDWNPQIEAEIDDMYAAGISSFKMYMTYPAMMIGDNAMYHALKKLKEKGGICGVHCENSGVIDAPHRGKEGRRGNGCLLPTPDPSGLSGGGSREPPAAGSLRRWISPWSSSTSPTPPPCGRWRPPGKRGQKVYAETCPQYLLLDDSV